MKWSNKSNCSYCAVQEMNEESQIPFKGSGKKKSL